MGGRGKTPLVAHIARLLLAAGERPAILSRGYGRRIQEDGVVVVSDGVHLHADLDRAGDEPLMLARAVPGAMVLVCDVRARSPRRTPTACSAPPSPCWTMGFSIARSRATSTSSW